MRHIGPVKRRSILELERQHALIGSSFTECFADIMTFVRLNLNASDSVLLIWSMKPNSEYCRSPPVDNIVPHMTSATAEELHVVAFSRAKMMLEMYTKPDVVFLIIWICDTEMWRYAMLPRTRDTACRQAMGRKVRKYARKPDMLEVSAGSTSGCTKRRVFVNAEIHNIWNHIKKTG